MLFRFLRGGIFFRFRIKNRRAVIAAAKKKLVNWVIGN